MRVRLPCRRARATDLKARFRRRLYARTNRLFISYKTDPTSGLTFQARAIKKELESKGGNYHVWFDKDSLEAGLDWNTQIYRNIPRSDILLLLLAEETATSDWVRREVDVAKGAQVTILPVLIRDFDDLQGALDRFDIPRLQAVSLYEGSEDEYEKLFAAIEQRKDDTRKAQQQFLVRLGRELQRRPFQDTQQHYRSYQVHPSERPASQEKDAKGPIVYLAAGDIMAMECDVFVNSENDYMQMARVFDDRMISSMLRYYGSHFDGANRLIEDTLQNELTDRVKACFTTRPLGMGTVVATKAGHDESRLVTHSKARFVFHAAVVSVQDGNRGGGKVLAPTNDFNLTDTVRKTLDMVNAVNKDRGVPPAKTKQAKEQYKPIESIISPLLGTGSGGLPVEKVAPLMARAIKEFILDEPETSLKRIYICAYTEDDVSIVDEALTEIFTPDNTDGEC